jgi:hypothetical protein
VNVTCYVLYGIFVNSTYTYNGLAGVLHTPEQAVNADQGLVLGNQAVNFFINYVNGMTSFGRYLDE